MPRERDIPRPVSAESEGGLESITVRLFLLDLDLDAIRRSAVQVLVELALDHVTCRDF